MNFNIGDRVYAGDWCEGTIVDVDTDLGYAFVEYETPGGGGTMPFKMDELELIPDVAPSLTAFKSAHGTVNVIVHYCSPEVTTLLQRFDIWNSQGKFEYDADKPNERAKICFECPIEFLDFVESSMGRACFQRMGVEEFYIEH